MKDQEDECEDAKFGETNQVYLDLGRNLIVTEMKKMCVHKVTN